MPDPSPQSPWGVVIPLALALIQAVAAALRVFAELGQPSPEPDFPGIILSNAVGSEGGRFIVALFRDTLAGLPILGDVPVFSAGAYVWSMRASLATLALVHLLALAACLRLRSTSWRLWAVGPVLTSLVLMAYPPINTDIFYYAMSAHTANLGENPYLVPPLSFPESPLLPFQDWEDITSPYGPLWTNVARVVVGITGPDPFAAAMGLKIVVAVAALGLAAITYRLAKRLTGDPHRSTAAFVLVAWQLALLVESAGTAHSDAVMMLVAVGGLLLLSSSWRGATRTGLVVVASSVLIKWVTLPLLGFAALWRLRERRDGLPLVAGRWALDLVAIMLLNVVVFAPYWAGCRTLDSLITEPTRLRVNPLWVWAVPRLGRLAQLDDLFGPIPDHRRTIAMVVTGLVLLATVAWLALRMWQLAGRPRACGGSDLLALRAQVRAWAIATATLSLIPINAHSWYGIWPIAPVALAWVSSGLIATDGSATPAQRCPPLRLRWWLVLYLVWTGLSFVVYHTAVTL